MDCEEREDGQRKSRAKGAEAPSRGFGRGFLLRKPESGLVRPVLDGQRDRPGRPLWLSFGLSGVYWRHWL